MSFIKPKPRATWHFAVLLAVGLAAFLLGVGLWPGRLPFPPTARFSDAVTAHWPNALFLRRAVLEQHTFPLWQPWVMSGLPFAANPLNKVWYPPQWLVLILPPAVHLGVLAWLHLWLGGLGMWRWTRGTGMGRGGAALAGVAYAFAPRVVNTVGGGHLDLVYAAGWLPWLLWAVCGLWASGGGDGAGASPPHPPQGTASPAPAARRAAARLAATPAVRVGVLASLIVLADVRLGAYGVALAAAYGVWCAWMQGRGTTSSGTPTTSRRSAISRVLGAGLLAAGLTAPLWVGLWLWRDALSRGTMSLADAAFDSMQPLQWVTLLLADRQAGEALVYVGASVLLLALIGLAAHPRRLAFWGVAIGLAALYATGEHSPLWLALNRAIPPLRWWRVPARAWYVGVVGLPYLAGWGAEHLARATPSAGRAARLGIVALVASGTLCGVVSTATLTAAEGVSWQETAGIFALPLTALVIALAIFGKVRGRALMAALLVVVLTDLLWIDHALVEGRGREAWLKPYRALAEHLRADGATRVYAPDYSLPQQASVYWEIAQFGGVDPFQTRRYVAAAGEATGARSSGYSVTIPPYEVAEPPADANEADLLRLANRDAPLRADLLGQWAVSHVVARYPIAADGLVLSARVGDVFVYRNAYAPPMEMDWDGPNRVTVRVAEGWRGTLYALAGGRWQGAPADALGLPGAVDGKRTTWEYRYSASEVAWGLGIGALLSALGVWIGRRGDA